MEKRDTGLRIGKRAFLTSAAILLALMLVAGALTRLIPTGSYARMADSVVPDSFQFTERAPYPVWRWFTAPVEVLWGPDSVTILSIVIFILIIGGTFAILDRCGLLRFIMQGLTKRFGTRRYTLMALLILFFMFFGSVFGMFEELVALVPIVVMLAYAMGWDALVGLGMSLLAAGFGFSSATLNPFTVGVAQTLSGLPLFSGLLVRIPIFLLMYAIVFLFVRGYAKKLERDPKRSLVYAEDRARVSQAEPGALENEAHLPRAAWIFGGSMAFVFLYILAGLLVNTLLDSSVLSDLSMVVMALAFLIGGLLAGRVSRYTAYGAGKRSVFSDFLAGVGGVAPGALLILMAMSVKYIVSTGGVMDTILYYAASAIGGLGSNAAILLVFALVLILNFFIGSATAKAFLVIPLIAPLTDMVGVSRQAAVQAFCFGDGFSNVIYPTNPVLMIALSLTVVSYVKWFRWTWKLQLLTLLLCAGMLVLLVALGF